MGPLNVRVGFRVGVRVGVTLFYSTDVLQNEVGIDSLVAIATS